MADGVAHLGAVLLALLSGAPNTGYGLGRLLRRELRHLWEARLQQIYAELARLHSQRLLQVTTVDLPKRPAKKVYSLTRAGERALDSWLAQPLVPRPPREQFLVWLYCLDRMPTGQLVRRLEQWREARLAEAASVRKTIAGIQRMDPGLRGTLLTLDYAASRLGCDADWAERAIAAVRDVEPAPSPIAKAPEAPADTA